MHPSPLQPASTGRRFALVGGVLAVHALGMLWAMAKEAAMRGGPFGEYAMAHALLLAGQAAIIGVGVWRFSGAMVPRGWKTASPEERVAWTVERRKGWVLTSVSVWLAAFSFWNAWSDPKSTLSAAELAMRVAPFVTWAVLLSAGVDAAARGYFRRRPASRTTFSPVEALVFGVSMVAFMALVMLPLTNAFYDRDLPGGRLDGYALTLDTTVSILGAMAPLLFIMAALMALCLGGITYAAARAEARRRANRA